MWCLHHSFQAKKTKIFTGNLVCEHERSNNVETDGNNIFLSFWFCLAFSLFCLCFLLS